MEWGGRVPAGAGVWTVIQYEVPEWKQGEQGSMQMRASEPEEREEASSLGGGDGDRCLLNVTGAGQLSK